MIKLLTREELFEIPCDIYERVSQKQFEDAIEAINKGMVKARRRGWRKFVYVNDKFTQEAVDKLQDEFQKAGYRIDIKWEHRCPEKWDNQLHNFVEVSW